MFKSYLKIAVRNLLQHKVFSLINIVGLSIGITCCILLALYIKNEFSFEQHFADADRVYRLYTVFKRDGKEDEFPRTSPPIPMTMLHEFPELESATRMIDPPEVDQHLVQYKDKVFYEKRGVLVDSTFFEVFPYEFKEGDRNTALHHPSAVVITEELASKLFTNTSALDELITISSGGAIDTFRITGVLQKRQHQSLADAGLYMCMDSNGWGEYINSITTWGGNNFASSFIKLKPQAFAADVEKKLPALLNKYGAAEMKTMGISKDLHLQPLLDIHLFSSFKNSFGDGNSEGSITNIYILSSIGIFILLIACINFMNLATAKSSQRAGEVGIRKSLGATRAALVGQFLGESLSIVILSMMLSLCLLQAILPVFNSITQKDLAISMGNVAYIAGAVIAIALITGILAGGYPAFFLSSFQPARVLKDRQALSGGSAWLRKSLVIFQFVVSITLVSAIVIMQRQLNFVANEPLGFDASYKIMLPLRTQEAREGYTAFKNGVQALAGVKEFSGSTALPSTNVLRDLLVHPAGSTQDKASIHLNINVDENYFKLLGIPLLKGRDLKFETDSVNFNDDLATRRIIVNRAALKESGIAVDNAIGQHLYRDLQNGKMDFEIVGIVEDFHLASLRQRIVPVMFLVPNSMDNLVYAIISIQKGSYNNLIPQIEKAWKATMPNTPFEHSFLDENVKRQYEADEREATVIKISTTIAILISCLGLYGLSIYVAERKVKEIGVRKVLGASVSSIVGMLSKEFLILISIAFVIAVPIGYWAMDWWLTKFEFHIQINYVAFTLAGVITFLITWLTVGFESMKAALSNPIKSLRND